MSSAGKRGVVLTAVAALIGLLVWRKRGHEHQEPTAVESKEERWQHWFAGRRSATST